MQTFGQSSPATALPPPGYRQYGTGMSPDTAPGPDNIPGQISRLIERGNSHANDLADINGRIEKFILNTIGPRPMQDDQSSKTGQPCSALLGGAHEAADQVERQLRILRNHLATIGA